MAELSAKAGHGEEIVDLRSDTVTKPTGEMRKAMAEAEVGDDCYGEDPTVNRLQDLACERLGTEAALFVPTGTMANQIALKVLSRPGGEVVCEERCHLIDHESGASAMLSQVQLSGLASRDGVLSATDVADAVRPADPYQPDTVLVAIENTHNAAGGTVWPLDDVKAVATEAREAGLPIFCDGARLFNACVAAGVSAADFAEPCDVVTISLYKGLCAPMGSLVCGSRELIGRAWTFRRVFGGALRQAGVVAAAGIVALERMVDRLAQDHEHASRLAAGMADTGAAVSTPATNMVVVDGGGAAEAILDGLRSDGVLAGLIGPGRIRFVTHHDVDQTGIDRAIASFARVREALR